MSNQLAFELEMGGPLTAPRGIGSWRQRSTDDFRILLAVTDDDLAQPTIQLGEALVTNRAAAGSVVYVANPDDQRDEHLFPYAGELVDDELQTLQARLRLDESSLMEAWPLFLEIGPRAHAIVRCADRVQADLILMGLRRHGMLERVTKRDTTDTLLALTEVPVLAVRPELTQLPKRIAVALDFSRSSIQAAKLARQLIDPRGAIDLIYVDQGEAIAQQGARDSDRFDHGGLGRAFERVINQLEAPFGMSVTAVTCKGSDVPSELIRCCEELHPDLVVVGRQPHSFPERLLRGSVAKGLIRDGRWSMLITPASYSVRI
jgi:nucleotide-binding universal stress UspA family protein